MKYIIIINIRTESKKEPVPSLYILSFVFHCDISFLLLVAYDGHFTAMSDKAVNNKVHSANTPLRPYGLYTRSMLHCRLQYIYIIYRHLLYIIRIMYRSYIINIMYRSTYLYQSFDPVRRHVLRAKNLLRSMTI